MQARVTMLIDTDAALGKAEFGPAVVQIMQGEHLAGAAWALMTSRRRTRVERVEIVDRKEN